MVEGGFKRKLTAILSADVEGYSQNAPALSVGHPFTNVQAAHSWSSAASAGGSPCWVYFGGGVGTNPVSNSYYVWPVRGGN